MGQFTDLFGSLFNEDFFNAFLGGKTEEQSRETFEITKGNYKTVVEIYFTKEGYPVSLQSRSENISQVDNTFKLEGLQKQLEEAVASEDYQKAADLQKEIKALEAPTQDTETN